jgi:hypothetical protein
MAIGGWADGGAGSSRKGDDSRGEVWAMGFVSSIGFVSSTAAAGTAAGAAVDLTELSSFDFAFDVAVSSACSAGTITKATVIVAIIRAANLIVAS